MKETAAFVADKWLVEDDKSQNLKEIWANQGNCLSAKNISYGWMGIISMIGLVTYSGLLGYLCHHYYKKV